MLKKKTLSDLILAILRPLYNLIFVDGNPFFLLPYDFKITLKVYFPKILGMPEMTLPTTKINF